MILESEVEVASVYRKWKKEAKRELDFCLGDQWRSEDKEQLKSEGRPALTFNEIQPVIRLITGFQSQNRQDIKVIGVEGGDEFDAHIFTLLIKNIMTRSYGEFKITKMFRSGIRTSKGWIEPDVVFDEDPISGFIKLRNSLYYQVFPDPDYTEYDMSDAEFVLKRLAMTKSRLLNMFPEKENIIKRLQVTISPFDEITKVEDDPDTGYEQEVDGDNSGVPFNRSERRLLHDLSIYHYKKFVKKLYAIDMISGQFKDVTDQKLSKRDQAQMLDAVNKKEENLVFLSQKIGVPWIAMKSGEELLEDNISPEWPHVKTFPMVPYVASFNPEARRPDKIFQGLVKALIDPQQEINKRASQRLHLVNATANAPWVGDTDALSPEGWQKLEKLGSTPGVVFRKKKGSQLSREFPVPAGQLHAFLIADASDQIKRTSGVNADLLGQSESKTVSGKALQIRQQSGIMVIQDVFDNLRYSRDILGRLLIGMILNNYTPEKIVRIVGEKQLEEDPQTGEISEVGEITTQEAEDLLNNFDMLKYDLAVDETQMSPVMRMAVGEELLALRDKLPSLQTGIADDLIVESTSIPHKKEIIKRIKSALQSQEQASPPA